MHAIGNILRNAALPVHKVKELNMNIRKSIEYKSVAVALDVPLDQVEFWIVDGILSYLLFLLFDW